MCIRDRYQSSEEHQHYSQRRQQTSQGYFSTFTQKESLPFMVNSRKSSPRPYIRSNSRRKSGMSTYHRRCSRRQREPCGYIRHKRRSSDSDIGSSPPGTPYCRDPCYKRWRNCCRLPPSILFYTSKMCIRDSPCTAPGAERPSSSTIL